MVLFREQLSRDHSFIGLDVVKFATYQNSEMSSNSKLASSLEIQESQMKSKKKHIR
ncbi:hypothetical protein ANCCAN_20716 [Ancylostoma caninum]|uniref:Uncharacterized protein n=1 Tax=Ancylostoma caninum TaxID=29170 RepID=A0A368FMJ4_ANCCA|nr:hypothetical protein ANCCAN_20716 [Ancylostoma caninum]